MIRLSLNELPAWFDLSKYETVVDFDLDQWSQNFMWRSGILQFMDIEGHRDASRQMFDKLIFHYQCVVNEEPSVDIDAISVDGKDDSSTSQLWQTTVGSLRVSYSAFVVSDVLHEKSAKTSRLLAASEYLWQEVNAEGDFLQDTENDEFLSKAIDLIEVEARDERIEDQFLHLEIDMHAPDTLIIEDFKKWLKAAREVFNLPSQNLFTEANMKSWATNRILAYLDLSIWAGFENVTVTDTTMGNALFPREFDKDVTERIRKTIRPKARWLTRSSVAEAMWNQSRRTVEKS